MCFRVSTSYKGNMIRESRIVVIGAGNVGVTTAFSLVTQGVCDEVCLIDLNEEKVYGEVLDLTHCIEFLNRNVKIRVGSYEDCRDAAVVVITASAPMAKDENNRLAMLDQSKKIVKSIVSEIMKNGFTGHMIIVSNPVDIMAYYAYKLSGLPASHVIGSGTSLDSARLKCFIGEKIHVDPRSVNAMIIGEHGDSEMVPWSCVTVGGKDFFSILRDNQSRLGNESMEGLRKKTIQAGWEIFNRKGNTCYGIASSVVGIIKAILFDENKIIPVSTLLEGQYGEEDIYIGVPVVLNRDGVREVVELRMTTEEKANFKASCDTIRSYYKDLDL